MSSKPAPLPQHIRNLLALHSITFRYDSVCPPSWALHKGNPDRVGTFLAHLYILNPRDWERQVAVAIEMAGNQQHNFHV